MKQFLTILKFELKNYYKNKIFVGITLFIVAAVAVLMFFPHILSVLEESGVNLDSDESLSQMYVLSKDESLANSIKEEFKSVFTDCKVTASSESVEWLKEGIKNGDIDYGFYFEDYTNYTYYVNNLSMYDQNTFIADEVLKTLYQENAMVNMGMTPEEANTILTAQINHTTENIGKDQASNFFYTYIMLFALYITIILYGQMVATSVATEKSSRAMELLITSASPTNMMFGKIIAACTAGLFQMIAIFGSSILFYGMNKSYWQENEIVKSIFGMPTGLLVYMLVFFLLGFLVYAFLYGAIGSTVSKLEDVNTAVMPLTFVFVFSLMAVVFSMTSSTIDSMLMKVLSYIPLTSPMAMFTRIAMSTVSVWEIAVSIGILTASVVVIGIIAAKIYRMGVLLYGTAPTPANIIKMLKNNKKQ